MDNYFKNESFRFNISISNRCYDHKPTSGDYSSMSFHVEELNVKELLYKIKAGYSMCHVFKDNRRVNVNFMCTHAVFIDVDDHSQPMETFLDGCELQPTIAYTTISDGANGLYRFRLIYLFDEPISSPEDYKSLYGSLIKEIGLEQNKDNCGSVVAQLMNGNSSSNVRVFCSSNIYYKSLFLQNCHLEIYPPLPPSQYISNRQFCKNEIVNMDMAPEDLVALQDLDSGVTEFLSKYSDVGVIDETMLDYNENGYAFFPYLYYKLNIRMDWTNKKPKVLKYKDGECRRKRLYVDALIMRAIKPDATFLEILYNLVLRRKFFYDNSDKVLTDEILIKDAQTVLKMRMDEVYSLNPSKHGTFKTDAIFCQEHGVSRKQYCMVVRKILNYQSIGEWYDVSMSVSHNYKYAKSNGIKVSLNTLNNFCRDNSIDMYPSMKPIKEWYDVSLSVKKNLELAKNQGIKVSQTMLYNYCREHHIDTKGRSDND